MGRITGALGEAVMTAKKTPVALFTYNRPDHTGRLLDSLSRCHRLDEIQLTIYCDGAKSEADRASVEASRTLVQSRAALFKAELVERPEHLGLAKSIVAGVSDLCRAYGRVIVVEDDLVLSPDFIDYMLQALDRYQDAPQVYQVSGFMFPIDLPATTDAIFLPLTTTWGWATWARAWQRFEWQPTGILDALDDPAVQRQFDLKGTYPYTAMLRDRLAGRNDSWGILWWWTVFQKRGIVLYPKESLVVNEGFDGSGVHCGNRTNSGNRAYSVGREMNRPFLFPSDMTTDEVVLGEVIKHMGMKVGSTGRVFGRQLLSKLAKYFAATGSESR
jgi:hypothetical protein